MPDDPLKRTYPCFVCHTPDGQARGNESEIECFFCKGSGKVTGESIAFHDAQGGGYPSDEYDKWMDIYKPAIDELERLDEIVKLTDVLKYTEFEIKERQKRAELIRAKLKELKSR